MPESETKARPCQACGQDCTGQPRIKDSKGRYLHKACYEKARAKAERRKPVEVQARPAPDADDHYGLDGDDLGLGDDLLANLPQTAGGPACPDCGSPSANGAILCTICGHNFQTGRSAGKVKVSKETAMGNASAAAASHSAAWLLALIGASIGGAVGAVAWAVVGVVLGLEIGYLAVGVGFLCGLGAALGARSKTGLVSGLVASGVAILAIAVGKFAIVQFVLDEAVAGARESIQAQMQNADQPWFTDEEALREMVSDESLRRERTGEVLRWPFGTSWEDAYEMDHYPPEVSGKIKMAWERMSETERASKKDELMRENMSASIADEIAWERDEQGQSITWPAGMTYDEAYLIEDYPPDIAREAQARWDAMSRQEQVQYLNKGLEEFAAMIENPELTAAMMSAGYGPKALFFDILWVVLAVGAAFGTGANVARGDAGF